MWFFKSLRLIISVGTVVVIILSMISTYLCDYFDLYADFPMTLIGIAVVFPIVFSISGAYKRRETALKYYGTMKSLGRSIYWANRDWIPVQDRKKNRELKSLLKSILINSRKLFNQDRKYMSNNEKQIYRTFSELSLFINDFRNRGMSGSEVSRCNQYFSKMMGSFESMKHIYQYRTPRGLRAYSKIFVHTLPIIYGPYFADIVKDTSIYLGFIMPLLFSFVLISLDNIQDHLENPFDLVGEDDIKINAEKFIKRLDP